jgi:hypothetical protein
MKISSNYEITSFAGIKEAHKMCLDILLHYQFLSLHTKIIGVIFSTVPVLLIMFIYNAIRGLPGPHGNK